MATLFDEVCRLSDEISNFFVRTFGIVHGAILFVLLSVAVSSYIALAVLVGIGFLTIHVGNLCKDATRSLRDQWLALPDCDPEKPRTPGTWPGTAFLDFLPPPPPNQAVCDPITDSADPSKDEKKKKKGSNFDAEQNKFMEQIEAKHKKDVAKLNDRYRKKLARLAKQHRHVTDLKDKEVADLKRRVDELDFDLKRSESSRARLSQLQSTSTDRYDKNMKIPGRIATMSVRLPMPDFHISDVIDRRKAQATPTFNVTFYKMPKTIVQFEAPVSAAQFPPSAIKAVEQSISCCCHVLGSLASQASFHCPVFPIDPGSVKSSVFASWNQTVACSKFPSCCYESCFALLHLPCINLRARKRTVFSSVYRPVFCPASDKVSGSDASPTPCSFNRQHIGLLITSSFSNADFCKVSDFTPDPARREPHRQTSSPNS
ncbi:LOW QUALITY PROTEIN: hypothetical protein ColTof4_07129 [Colletotrichum tofieldiae]|nr:LOW QUALITY PROTEIN: hypothetical protein ColTof3_12071 [Colletotrichum tofieldiae]GKT74706.1 LOW QUALITY PROTEIN: hypothetical protein ColTof4_07129 [Colletotrichum tofieldiae]